jgi:hypothetical protein
MPIDDVTPVDTPFLKPKITYKDHQDTLGEMDHMYGIRPDQLLDGCGLAAETVTISTHAGTHVDAIPATGFKIACFPTKVKSASAGWTRCVAIFED